jgi:hypothetical protein
VAEGNIAREMEVEPAKPEATRESSEPAEAKDLHAAELQAKAQKADS